MGRSSWHCFWMLSTVENGFITLFFLFAVMGGQGRVEADLVSPGVSFMQLALERFSNDLAALGMVFFAFATIVAGTAWWACAMALRERKQEPSRPAGVVWIGDVPDVRTGGPVGL